jgi:phytoene dehydrogenase-like protein
MKLGAVTAALMALSVPAFAQDGIDIEGLYLAGGSAHPGPGMPMVMMSGWIAADCVDQDQLVPRASTPRARGTPVGV